MPWLRVEADLPWNPKILDLPSDADRWAYLKALCLAKQRQSATFPRNTLAEFLGTNRRAIPALVRAGLLDESEGQLAVHDFDDYQRRAGNAERQERFRERHGGVTDESRNGNAGGNDPNVTETLPTRRDMTGRDMTVTRQDEDSSFSVTDTMSKFDLTDPTDVWSMYSNGRELTEKQQVAVAGWILSEGRDEVVELMKTAWRYQGSGSRTGFDPFGYVKDIVQKRRDERVDTRAALDQRRKEVEREEREQHDHAIVEVAEADPEQHRRSLLRGRAIRLKMDNPGLPDVPTEAADTPALEEWLEFAQDAIDEGRTR